MFRKSLATIASLLLLCTVSAKAQNTNEMQMEKLGRGAVAVPGKSSGIFVSWRLLGNEDNDNTTFDVLRDGVAVVTDYWRATSYNDSQGKATSCYQIVTKHNGVAVDTTDVFMPWAEPVLQVKLQRPAGGSDYSYSPNDCSVGDVDGDGEYELFVKWDPSNAKDNSQNGVTGNVFIDCYKFSYNNSDGSLVKGQSIEATKLWRIDLGPNIRAGAHYTQFMVYDFDGDGRAELMCKTAPGSIDGKGKYVNQATTNSTIKSAVNTTVYRNSNGRITGGQEYLTVFNGQTGAAINTIFYNPNRDTGYGGAASGTFNWDDRSGKSDKASYGNRGERYLAAVAYLDGPDKRPAGVFCRGYYTYAYVWAVDFDGKELTQKWFHASDSKTSYKLTSGTGSAKTYTPGQATSGGGSRTLYGNGNHNLSVADVDGDGCDEIIWGSAALNNDGKLLYATGFGHGDAIHLSDLAPDRPGLELFDVHEEKGTYSWDIHDAATGEVIWKGGNSGVDNGRGIAAQLSSDHRGFFCSSADQRSQLSASTGQVVSAGSTSLNFRIYWDGDVQDELLDGTVIDSWNGNGTTRLKLKGADLYGFYNSSSCNGTKNTPNLQADIFGDWREEVILWNSGDSETLNIFTTPETTNYRVPTLMHDHTYRMGICWQNVAYNQPPHLGYYLPDRFVSRLRTIGESQMEQTLNLGDSIMPVTVQYYNCSSLGVDSTFTPSEKDRGLHSDFTLTRNTLQRQVTLKGKPSEEGTYAIVLRLGNNSLHPGYVYYTITLNVNANPDHIGAIGCSANNKRETFTLSGMRIASDDLDTLPSGIYIVRENGQTRKIRK